MMRWRSVTTAVRLGNASIAGRNENSGFRQRLRAGLFSCLAQLVGEQGYVLGVDMTDEQLAVANDYIGYHMEEVWVPLSPM